MQTPQKSKEKKEEKKLATYTFSVFYNPAHYSRVSRLWTGSCAVATEEATAKLHWNRGNPDKNAAKKRSF